MHFYRKLEDSQKTFFYKCNHCDYACTFVDNLRTFKITNTNTIFTANFPVRIHVRLKLPSSFARFVTLLTGYHTIIMLVLHVHPQMFFRRSFKTAYDTRKHGDCRFVLLAMMLCVSNVIIFPYQKENLLVENGMF